MAIITIQHLELRREVASTPAGAELCTRILLDGRRLTAWFAFLAGREDGWMGWPEDDDWDAILHGRTADAVDGRTELCRCECSCSGCDPLLVRIEVDEEFVTWRDLAHGSTPVAVPDVCFRFPREDYEQALRDFQAWDGTIDE